MGYPEPVSITGSTFHEIACKLAKKARKTYTVEVLGAGMIKFDNGATLIVEASWAVNNRLGEEMITQLYGTKGGLVQRNVNGQYEFEAEVYTDEDGRLFTKKLDWSTVRAPALYSEFVSSILEERPPLATGEDRLKVMKILEGAVQERETGKKCDSRRSDARCRCGQETAGRALRRG
jgi:predicted dehydrogenase